MGYCTLVALCLPLADLHHFCLTKWFPKTHSAILPIRMPSAFCIDQIVPGFVVYHLNCSYTLPRNELLCQLFGGLRGLRRLR